MITGIGRAPDGMAGVDHRCIPGQAPSPAPLSLSIPAMSLWMSAQSPGLCISRRSSAAKSGGAMRRGLSGWVLLRNQLQATT